MTLLLVASLGGCATSPRSDGERAAEQKTLDAESASRLVLEGELFFQADPEKRTGYQYCSLSIALLEQGEIRLAIREASKALFLGQRYRDQCLTGLAERDLASAYSVAGYLDRAEQLAHAAMSDTLRCRDAASVGAAMHKVLGDVALRRGRPREAIAEYEKAGSASSHGQIAASLANAHLANGNTAVARKLFEGAGNQLTPLTKAFVDRGLAQVALAEGRYDDASRLFTEAATRASGRDAAYERFLAFAGLGQTRSAAGDANGSAAAYRRAIAAAEEIRARFRSEEFKTGFFGDVQKVFDDAVMALASGGASEEAFSVSERSRARAFHDLLRDRVRSKMGTEVFAEAAERVTTAAEISSLMPDGMALVEYHLGPRRSYAWVVRRSGLRMVQLNLDRQTATADAKAFRRGVGMRDSGAQAVGHALYERLIAPLELNAAEALIIVPHGALHYLPFQALRGPRGYLVEEHAVSYAPSASALRQLLTIGPPSRGPVLGLGNPDIGVRRLPLPGAEREVRKLAALFNDAEIYVGKEATKDRLLSRAPASRVLHVAAHAEVDDIDPLYSVIRLAATEKMSGELEAHEVYGLDLHGASMVVLSGCETGLGKVSRGDEIWGFTRSFLAAGSRSVIVSLWPIEDEATSTFMEQFYLEVSRGTRQDAVRSAALAIRRDPRLREPYYWAAFNLVGDWR